MLHDFYDLTQHKRGDDLFFISTKKTRGLRQTASMLQLLCFIYEPVSPHRGGGVVGVGVGGGGLRGAA